MKDLAVVILNYNGKHFLEKFLPNVVQYSDGAQVIVADNGSTDDSLGWLNSHFPNVPIIQLAYNNGYAGGYNEALRKVNAEYFLLLNSDVEVTPNGLGPLYNKIKQKEVACVQPKLMDYNRKHLFEYAGAAGGWIDILGYPFCRGRVFEEMEVDEGQYDNETELFWASGACFLIRANVFFGVGGFDVRFFAHMEEIDLCWRIKNMGYKILFAHESVVYHVGGGTLSKQNPKKTYLNVRNNLFMLFKNLPAYFLVWVLPLRVVLDVAAALSLWLIQNRPKDCIAVLEAHWVFWSRFVMQIRERRRVPRRAMKYPGVYFGSILVEHFFRKRLRFKDLPVSKTKHQ